MFLLALLNQLEQAAQHHDLQGGDPTTTLVNLCQCSVTCTVQKYFLMFRMNLLCRSLCPLPLALTLGNGGKSLAPSSLQPGILYTLMRFPLSHLQAELPQPFFMGKLLQSLTHSCGSSLDSLQYCPYLLELGTWWARSELDTAF